ncbi:MAG: gamma-glutamylcyclotransferase family protein [Gammaproteobacteria bacterium]|nr:gamma-glutamylcyclotransferase family protein [Gammaproteobacteria bacterium]
MNDANNHVFIYGTLKRGYRNHKDYLKFEKYLGEYRTVDCYPLVIANEWYAPVLLQEKGIGHQVVGELYSVDDIKLTELDKLERTHHIRGYKRILIAIQNIINDEYVEAYTYMNERKNLKHVGSEYMPKYTDSRYIPLNER